MSDVLVKEIADRMRRLETRFTKFMEMQGFDTKVRRPEFHDGVVSVPSPSCSIHDIVQSIPPSWDKESEVEVRCNSDYIASVYLVPAE